MDMTTMYSAAQIVQSTFLDQAILGFESAWIFQFWMAEGVQADSAFCELAFQKYLDKHNVSLGPVPRQRHSPNPLECKHGIIRSIFLKLRIGEPNVNNEVHALRSVTISNDLYVNDVMSSFELETEITKPVIDSTVYPISDYVVNAQAQLQARRKLAIILKSKSIEEISVTAGDLIEVFSKTGMDKKGNWSVPKTVSSVDKKGRSVTVSAKRGKRAVVAFEDIRIAFISDCFASVVQDAVENLEESIDYLVNVLNSGKTRPGEICG